VLSGTDGGNLGSAAKLFIDGALYDKRHGGGGKSLVTSPLKRREIFTA